MAVILQDPNGDDLMINWWNWRPAVALMVSAEVLPKGEREERCLANGCGGYFTDGEASRAAEFFEHLLLSMKPGQRVFSDGTITDQPKDYNLPVSEWDEIEAQDHYSVEYHVVDLLAKFCRRSGGFEVI